LNISTPEKEARQISRINAASTAKTYPKIGEVEDNLEHTRRRDQTHAKSQEQKTTQRRSDNQRRDCQITSTTSIARKKFSEEQKHSDQRPIL
jgi:hypothetical protein